MLHKFKPFELVVSQAPTGALRVLVMSALSILNLWAMPVTNAQAQSGDYPNRTIRMIVPQGAGGGTDILGRNVAAKFQDILRQSVVVENRTGAGSIIGTDHVAKSAADGYTLMVGGIFNIVMNKALVKDLPYDPARDFAPLGFVSAYPFLLICRADLPVNSLAEFVKYARANPGKLSYVSAGLGTLQHVWGAILVKQLGLDMLHVPFKGAAPAHQEMLGGRVDIMFDNISASKGYVQSAKMKGLAVSSVARSAALPQVPTVNETGVTRFEGESWFGIFVPAATPAPILARLREALLSVTRDKDFVARVERDGGRVLDLSPTQQQAFMRDEIDRWSKLVTQYGVTAD